MTRLQPHRRVQSFQVPRNPWLWTAGGLLVAAGAAGVFIRLTQIHLPPDPPPAALPASARVLLQPFRKNSLDLTLNAHGDVEYRIAMQAGATLVYSWAASHGTVLCQFADQTPGAARQAHAAFVAQSSGWYVWRWKNPGGDPVTIHLKLSGYYEPSGLP